MEKNKEELEHLKSKSLPEGKHKVFFQFIENYQELLTIVESCKKLKVFRVGFYKNKHHRPSKIEVENEVLSDLVAQIFKEHKERYGFEIFNSH